MAVTKYATRPPKYKDWMPEKLVELSKTHLMVEIADKWEVTRYTLYKWSRDPDKPDFAWAYKRAKDRVFNRIIKMGMDGLVDKGFNSKMWDRLARVLLMEEYKINADLPGFAKASPKQRIKLIFEAAERGELRTTEIKDMIEAIGRANDIEKFLEIEERLAKIERKMG